MAPRPYATWLRPSLTTSHALILTIRTIGVLLVIRDRWLPLDMRNVLLVSICFGWLLLGGVSAEEDDGLKAISDEIRALQGQFDNFLNLLKEHDPQARLGAMETQIETLQTSFANAIVQLRKRADLQQTEVSHVKDMLHTIMQAQKSGVEEAQAAALGEVAAGLERLQRQQDEILRLLTLSWVRDGIADAVAWADPYVRAGLSLTTEAFELGSQKFQEILGGDQTSFMDLKDKGLAFVIQTQTTWSIWLVDAGYVPAAWAPTVAGLGLASAMLLPVLVISMLLVKLLKCCCCRRRAPRTAGAESPRGQRTTRGSPITPIESRVNLTKRSTKK